LKASPYPYVLVAVAMADAVALQVGCPMMLAKVSDTALLLAAVRRA
jgi:hypothetical protein